MKRPGLVLAMALLLNSISSPLNGDPEGSVCISEFATPSVKYLARGGLAEEVRTRIRIDEAGKPAQVEILEGNPLLAGAVSRSLPNWRFCRCSTKASVVLTFRFRLEGAPTDYWSPTRVIFRSSGIVDVIHNPPGPHP